MTYIFEELKRGHQIVQLYKLKNYMLFTQPIKYFVQIVICLYFKGLLWNLFGVHAFGILSGSCYCYFHHKYNFDIPVLCYLKLFILPNLCELALFIFSAWLYAVNIRCSHGVYYHKGDINLLERAVGHWTNYWQRKIYLRIIHITQKR